MSYNPLINTSEGGTGISFPGNAGNFLSSTGSNWATSTPLAGTVIYENINLVQDLDNTYSLSAFVTPGRYKVSLLVIFSQESVTTESGFSLYNSNSDVVFTNDFSYVQSSSQSGKRLVSSGSTGTSYFESTINVVPLSSPGFIKMESYASAAVAGIISFNAGFFGYFPDITELWLVAGTGLSVVKISD